MMVSDPYFYNSMSSERLGWEPSWFGVEGFGDDLLDAVKLFQKEYGLVVDGLVGPATYARKYTERVVEQDEHIEQAIQLHGQMVPIDWAKVDLVEYAMHDTNYSKGKRDKSSVKNIITHWDATLSAKRCHSILSKRGISTHFIIDNDGTIYQCVDPVHKAWHAGKYNTHSIGIDFSNAYYTKYQSWYVKNGFGERPVLKNQKVHGRTLPDFLGYYPVQIEAYEALVKVLTDFYDIPLICPTNAHGNFIQAAIPEEERSHFQGVMSHYHVSENKIDCAGLHLPTILSNIKGNQ